ncbi:hypothetical protein BKA83DRAFT_4588626 [Pisolithus microcarpus]|nr:hypothetical protein BKA83DRAFT_4588626 [Pisolithus microcarpus]
MSASTDKVPLRKSCVYLIKVDNSGYLEGVVCLSYFVGLDDVVLGFAVVLSRTQMPLDTSPRAIKIRPPNCHGHRAHAPMIFQTTLYSDCSGRSSNNVLAPQSTARHIATPPGPLWRCADSNSYSPFPAQLPLESTWCTDSGPVSRLISKPNPRQLSCFSHLRQRLRIFAKDMNSLAVCKIKTEGNTPRFRWLRSRSRDLEELAVRLGKIKGICIPYMRVILSMSNVGMLNILLEEAQQVPVNETRQLVGLSTQKFKPARRREQSTLPRTCMVLMYILAKSTVVWERKKGASALSWERRVAFYTASLLKKATFRTHGRSYHA